MKTINDEIEEFLKEISESQRLPFYYISVATALLKRIKEAKMSKIKSTLVLIVALLTFSGCNSLERLTTGSDDEDRSEPRLVTVSCCRESGTYPSSVPASHQNLCSEISSLNSQDKLYQGNVWLAMSVDCGTGHHEIGDEYYQ